MLLEASPLTRCARSADPHISYSPSQTSIHSAADPHISYSQSQAPIHSAADSHAFCSQPQVHPFFVSRFIYFYPMTDSLYLRWHHHFLLLLLIFSSIGYPLSNRCYLHRRAERAQRVSPTEFYCALLVGFPQPFSPHPYFQLFPSLAPLLPLLRLLSPPILARSSMAPP